MRRTLLASVLLIFAGLAGFVPARAEECITSREGYVLRSEPMTLGEVEAAMIERLRGKVPDDKLPFGYSTPYWKAFVATLPKNVLFREYSFASVIEGRPYGESGFLATTKEGCWLKLFPTSLT